ncbi:hypothetical protein Acr_00g0090270 [Actinidia rufa]|uniref:Uncharacterized protein n=1 Tax=Actinidia rufa TaxID=165716 RepID=A0A7J0DXH7_9ERIC|nr:hypothetical protein Acr_00g0090270 [Actinidia rufa]
MVPVSHDFFSLFFTSSWFGDNFSLPDFFVDRLLNPSTAKYGTDRGTPSVFKQSAWK